MLRNILEYGDFYFVAVNGFSQKGFTRQLSVINLYNERLNLMVSHNLGFQYVLRFWPIFWRKFCCKIYPLVRLADRSGGKVGLNRREIARGFEWTQNRQNWSYPESIRTIF